MVQALFLVSVVVAVTVVRETEPSILSEADAEVPSVAAAVRSATPRLSRRGSDAHAEGVPWNDEALYATLGSLGTPQVGPRVRFRDVVAGDGSVAQPRADPGGEAEHEDGPRRLPFVPAIVRCLRNGPFMVMMVVLLLGHRSVVAQDYSQFLPFFYGVTKAQLARWAYVSTVLAILAPLVFSVWSRLGGKRMVVMVAEIGIGTSVGSMLLLLLLVMMMMVMVMVMMPFFFLAAR